MIIIFKVGYRWSVTSQRESSQHRLRCATSRIPLRFQFTIHWAILPGSLRRMCSFKLIVFSDSFNVIINVLRILDYLYCTLGLSEYAKKHISEKSLVLFLSGLWLLLMVQVSGSYKSASFMNTLCHLTLYKLIICESVDVVVHTFITRMLEKWRATDYHAVLHYLAEYFM